MILEKAKAIAFSNINDDESQKAEGKFEAKYRQASYQDAYSEVVGRKLRM
jgi:predicted nucleic acid-binding protein